MSTKNTKPSALALQSATAIMLRLRDFNRTAKDYAAGGGIITAQQMQTYDGRAQIVMNLRDEIAAEVDRAIAKGHAARDPFPEVERLGVLSTGHIPKATARYLDDGPLGVVRAQDSHGWLLNVTEEAEEEVNAAGHGALAGLLAVSRVHGLNRLLLDCDGPTSDSLPTFD